MSKVVLIKVSGVDTTGITAELSKLLQQQSMNVLDIGQAVIHEQLVLGVMVEVPASAPEDWSNALADWAGSRHLSLDLDEVAEEHYQHWVAQQGQPRHIVTLLARKITAAHLAAVSAVAARNQLNIDAISRLSGRLPLAHRDEKSKACVEFSVRGVPRDEAALRAEFMEICRREDIDVAIQEDNVYRRNRRLVCFDMDSTLIQAEVIDELAVEAGVGDEVAAITEAAMRGELDFRESFSRRMSLLEGLDEKVLTRVAERIPLTEGAEKLVATLRRLGMKTAILSGGFDFFGRLLQQRLGIDYVFANTLEFNEQGKLTGRALEPIVDGERKAQLLRELAQRENISLEQVIAVGDGANDLPMLSIAGLGIAFHAKPKVKASARQSISTLGLDGILYLLGLRDRDME